MSGWSSLWERMRQRMGKRSKTDFLILILAGVLVMVIAIPTGESEKRQGDDKAQETERGESEEQQAPDYRDELESQLEELLGQMAGVGDCRVMITLEDSGQAFVDKNLRSAESDKEQETVVYRQDDGEQPYVIRQRMPKVAGVVVVAQGGDNAKVITDISNAVMSLFQIEAHKITVVKMSVQEE